MENHNFPKRLSLALSNGEAGGVEVSIVRTRVCFIICRRHADSKQNYMLSESSTYAINNPFPTVAD